MPGRAAVCALEKPAARAAGAEIVRLAAHVPHCGVNLIRILRVHNHFCAAGAVVAVKQLVPGLSPVGGLEHATFRVRIPEMPQRAGEDGVAVLRMHDQTAYVLGVWQSDGVPVLSAIARAIYSGSHRHTITDP